MVEISILNDMLEKSIILNLDDKYECTSSPEKLENEAARRFVKQLPSLMYEPYQNLREPTCASCLADFKFGDEMSILPSCWHAFHEECVMDYFLENKNCPFCKKGFH